MSAGAISVRLLQNVGRLGSLAGRRATLRVMPRLLSRVSPENAAMLEAATEVPIGSGTVARLAGGLGGSALGAALGGAVAGPPGALIGSILGGVLGDVGMAHAGAGLLARLGVSKAKRQLAAQAFLRSPKGSREVVRQAAGSIRQEVQKEVEGKLAEEAKQAARKGAEEAARLAASAAREMKARQSAAKAAELSVQRAQAALEKAKIRLESSKRAVSSIRKAKISEKLKAIRLQPAMTRLENARENVETAKVSLRTAKSRAKASLKAVKEVEIPKVPKGTIKPPRITKASIEKRTREEMAQRFPELVKATSKGATEDDLLNALVRTEVQGEPLAVLEAPPGIGYGLGAGATSGTMALLEATREPAEPRPEDVIALQALQADHELRAEKLRAEKLNNLLTMMKLMEAARKQEANPPLEGFEIPFPSFAGP